MQFISFILCPGLGTYHSKYLKIMVCPLPLASSLVKMELESAQGLAMDL